MLNTYLQRLMVAGSLSASGLLYAQEFEPCLLDAVRQVPAVAATCANMAVPENWQQPDQRKINLRVAVVAARKPSSKLPDPILFLAGGPGQAATEAYPLLAGAFKDLNETRDIVLIDQRGTGQSSPLDCNFDGSWDLLGSDVEMDWAGYVGNCLEGVDVDPRHFTTVDAIADFEHVRKTLGYAQYNLVGVSYGTRAALIYAREHPDSIRTMVIDGVVPSQEPLGFSHAVNLENALRRTFERCATDMACNEHFPDIANKLEVLMARLAHSPESITMRHPTSGEIMTLEVSDEIVAMAIRILSYSPQTLALLPLLINDAAEHDQIQPLAAQAVLAVESISDQLSRGMELSVLCSEDAPYYEGQVHAGDNSIMGRSLLEGVAAQCEHWPHKSAPANFKRPTESAIPTLLLSGELDPVTPPSFAELAASTLSNSLHVVAPGLGHNVINRGCMPDLVQQFMDSASVADLDTHCINILGPEPFFTSYSGPEP